MFGDPRLPSRFWAKVAVSEDGCWRWTAALHGFGYGMFWLGGKMERAHRAAYVALVGPIPPGLELDHLCRVRACCNPLHLEAVTRRENILRGDGPVRAAASMAAIGARRARRPTCERGHQLSGDNLRIRPDGSRFCRACRKVREAA